MTDRSTIPRQHQRPSLQSRADTKKYTLRGNGAGSMVIDSFSQLPALKALESLSKYEKELGKPLDLNFDFKD